MEWGPNLSRDDGSIDTVRRLGRTEVLVAALDKHVLSLGLFLKQDDFPCRVRLGPASGHHIDRIRSRGW